MGTEEYIRKVVKDELAECLAKFVYNAGAVIAVLGLAILFFVIGASLC